ncbi:MAG: hypothetical protein APR53_00105 [Methanoculleus sp. SDB]|nr:MAG: hypothetical protein APR53_00105 [Methanoculleus sp. SDB]
MQDFPNEARWHIAARALSRMIIAAGQQVQAQEPIPDAFYALADEIGRIAGDHNMPRGNAGEIIQTLGIISVMLFGPAFETPYIEGFSEEAVIRLTRCPLYDGKFQELATPETIRAACCAYLVTVIGALNPGFTLSVPFSRCAGDEFCEMVIERKKG